MSKYRSFERFFNPIKSKPKKGSGIHQQEKLKQTLVWDSFNKGTYIKSIHGELI